MFFSDAVVAIAITLLALELPVPHARTDAEFVRRVGELRGDYVAFLISFAVVGTQWLGHNRLLAGVGAVSGRLVQWNMLWLLTVVVTPFATRVLTEDGAFGARFAVYAGVQTLSGAWLWLMQHEIGRCGLRGPAATGGAWAGRRRLAVMTAAFLISIPVGFLTHWAYVCWLAGPIAARLLELVERRRRPGLS